VRSTSSPNLYFRSGIEPGLPLPVSLRGGAAGKVVGALLTRGVVAETVTDAMNQADTALNRFWRNEADGRAVLVHLTEAGLYAAQGAHAAAAGAVGVQDGVQAGGAEDRGGSVAATEATDALEAASDADTDHSPGTQRSGTQQATLIAMVRSAEGTTIDEIVAATGRRRTLPPAEAVIPEFQSFSPFRRARSRSRRLFSNRSNMADASFGKA
jgi:hypothetical protein